MSTKIFGAYEYDGNIVQLYNFLRKFRLELLSKMEDIIFQKTVDYAQRCADYREAFNTIMDDAESQTKSNMNGIMDDLDFKTNCAIYLDDERIVVQFFIDTLNHKRFKQLFEDWVENNSAFSDYHFQDQTDPYFAFEDEEYSEKELQKLEDDWKNRREFYNKTFARNFLSPSVAGLGYTFIEYMDVAFSASLIFERLQRKYEIIKNN